MSVGAVGRLSNPMSQVLPALLAYSQQYRGWRGVRVVLCLDIRWQRMLWHGRGGKAGAWGQREWSIWCFQCFAAGGAFSGGNGRVTDNLLTRFHWWQGLRHMVGRRGVTGTRVPGPGLAESRTVSCPIILFGDAIRVATSRCRLVEVASLVSVKALLEALREQEQVFCRLPVGARVCVHNCRDLRFGRG